MRSRDRVAFLCCTITVGFCALAFGGAVHWGVLGASAGALGCAIPYLHSRQRATQLSPLLLLIAIAIGLTLVQLVPLPAGLAGLVASQKLELVVDHAQAWRTPSPAFVAASYDPPATLVELAKLCGYAALAFASLRIASHRTGRRALAAMVVGVAVAIAVVALAHEAVGATSIYGVFQSPIRDRLVSPIINANHLASLMALAVPVALGVALSTSGPIRLLWFGSGGLCAAIALLISSRGGAIGLGIGIAVTTILLVLQRRHDREGDRTHSRSWIPALVIGGCITVLIAAFTGTEVFDEIASTHVGDLHSSGSKVIIWEKALHMLEAHPILGTGRGAFEQAFASWSDGGSVSYSHAENSYVQPIVDWGLPGAIALGLVALALVRKAMRAWLKSPLEAGVLGGLVSLAAHDLADFSLELPVVAMAAVVLFAILVPPQLVAAQTGGVVEPLAPRRKWLRYGLIAGGALVCLLTATGLGQPAHASAADISGTPQQRLDAAELACRRHPADYLVFGRAAQALLDVQDPRAIAVLDRALYLNPTHFGLHRLAATMLVRAQRQAQAQAELARAIHYAPDVTLPELLAEAIATFPEPDEAARAMPLDLARATVILPVLAEHHDEAVALAYSQRLALLHPTDPTAQLLLARAALAAKQGAIAVAAGRQAFRLQPDAESTLALGRALALVGNAGEAIKVITDALAAGVAPERRERVRVLTLLVDLELGTNALEPAAKTLDELMRLVTERAERIAVLTRRAVLHDRLNEPSQAGWDRDLARKLESGDGI